MADPRIAATAQPANTMVLFIAMAPIIPFAMTDTLRGISPAA